MTDADLLLYDRRRHLEALVSRGADALRRGQFARAFAHADRPCRINRPNASDYLFRSATARAAGFADLAAADLARAAEADPTDQTVLHLLLRYGDAEARRGARARSWKMRAATTPSCVSPSPNSSLAANWPCCGCGPSPAA